MIQVADIIDDILHRVYEQTGLKKDKDLADEIGMSKSNFSQQRKRGTIIGPIVRWAIKEQIDLNWLIKGEEKQSGDIEDMDLKELHKAIGRLTEMVAQKDERIVRLEAEISELKKCLPAVLGGKKVSTEALAGE